MKPKILIVEDEEHLAIGLRFNFEAEDYDVAVAGDGPTALKAVAQADPEFDVVVLDLMLPGMSGYEVLQSFRATHPGLPVLILSAKSLAEDRVKAFDIGADQYLTKPFELRELISMVKNLLDRRSNFASKTTKAVENTKPTTVGEVLTFSESSVNFRTHEVSVSGKKHKLTPLHLKLLKLFAENEGAVLSRGEILENVWGFDIVPNSTRVVDNAVFELRKVFEADRANPQHFQSVRSAGYRFVANPI